MMKYELKRKFALMFIKSRFAKKTLNVTYSEGYFEAIKDWLGPYGCIVRESGCDTYLPDSDKYVAIDLGLNHSLFCPNEFVLRCLNLGFVP